MQTHKHKANVIAKYPETLYYKTIGGIPLGKKRFDLTKKDVYIVKNDNSLLIDSDDQYDDIILPNISDEKINKKNKIDFNVKIYNNDYYNLDNNERINLITKFVKYMKENNINPELFFDYEHYLDNKNIGLNDAFLYDNHIRRSVLSLSQDQSVYSNDLGINTTKYIDQNDRYNVNKNTTEDFMQRTNYDADFLSLLNGRQKNV